MYDVVVLGGGVAGLTAALFAARGGWQTVCLCPGIPGGLLATIERIEDFPGFSTPVAGYELGPQLQEQAAQAGAAFLMEEAVGLEAGPDGLWRVHTATDALETRTVIIATGSRPRELGVPGEARLRGRGVSHCASCDGPLLRGKAVIVVGGGDSAFQEALTLADFAADVLVVHDGPHPSAQAVYRERVAGTPVIRLRATTTVTEIQGDDVVRAARLRDLGTAASEDLEVAAVFVYIGLQSNTEFLGGLLPLDAAGRIVTDANLHTPLPGVFAAGDVRAGAAGQAVTAAGDGAAAAQSAAGYLAVTHS